MKSENYDELLNKFYAGTATANEISLLKKAGMCESDELYAAAISEDRNQTMDWTFEDLIEEVSEAKLIPLTRNKVSLNRMLTAAAAAAAIVMAVILWPTAKPYKELADKVTVEKKADSNKPLTYTAPAAFIATTTEDKNVPKKQRSSESKSASTVKQNQTLSFKKNILKKPNAEAEVLQDYLVIVNGKPITNEQDAIDITRASLAMFSRNLSSTMEELKPIEQIRIKL